MTVTVRDIRTGATLRTFDTNVDIVDGLMTGSHLFWRGNGLPRDAEPRIDGGVWVIDLADPESVPQTIIPPADLDEKYGSPTSRGFLRLTDQGRTLITNINIGQAGVTDIIDVTSLSLRQTFVFPQGAVEIMGDFALVVPSHSDVIGADHPNRIRLIDMATGDEIWRAMETELVLSTVVGDGEVFVQYGRNGSDAIIAAIELETGETRDLRVSEGGTETWIMSRELSVPHVLVLRPVDDLDLDAQGKVQLPLALLDPASGDFQPAAISIGSP